MPVNIGVRLEGLRELQAALRRADRELPKLVRRTLRSAARIVADDAKVRAPKRSHRLERSIRPFARGNVAGVRVSARKVSRKYPQGYNYPPRIEFGGRTGGEAAGPRAFLHPAFLAKRGEVIEKLEGVLDDLADLYEGG